MTASVRTQMTKATEDRLQALGYTEAEIGAMPFSEVDKILAEFDATANTNGHDDLDVTEALASSFKPPDKAAEDAEEAQDISPQRVADAIKALGQVAEGLGEMDVIRLLEPMTTLIGELQENDREPAINALYPILKSKDSVDNFLLKVPPPPGTPVFTPYSFDELLAMPPKEMLIDQVMGRGDIGMFYGMPGCNKTFTVVDLIICACLGKQWATRFDVARPLNVAYCAGEGISGLPARFAAAAQHHGAERLPTFTFFKTIPQFFAGSDDDITGVTIKQFVTEWKTRQAAGQANALDILVIDTLHTATTAADENSAKDMGKVLHLCRWASIELGCAVVLVHHTNKTGSAERGSSALRGAMDFMIEIKRISPENSTSTKAVMSCAKLKDGEQWKEQTLDLTEMGDSVRVWWDEPSDSNRPSGQKAEDKAALKAEMERYCDKRFTIKSLSEVIAKSDNYTRNLISELEKSGECKRELNDPNKSSSPRNPWVYYVESVETTLTEAGL